MRNSELIRRLSKKEVVYFKNSFDEVVFKADPLEGYLAKRKNGKVYKIEIGAKLLTEAFLEGCIITKEDFESY